MYSTVVNNFTSFLVIDIVGNMLIGILKNFFLLKVLYIRTYKLKLIFISEILPMSHLLSLFFFHIKVSVAGLLIFMKENTQKDFIVLLLSHCLLKQYLRNKIPNIKFYNPT